MSNNNVLLGFTGFTVNPSALGKGDITALETGGLVAELLQDKYRELFSVIDTKQLGKALMAWFRLHAPMSGPELSITKQLEWGEVAIYELLQRGALRIIVQTPDVDADLQKLAAAVAKANLRPQSTAAAVIDPDVPAKPDPAAECTKDFQQLHSSDFRKKWMANPEARKVFDALVREGRL